jgi:hypothetical protein
MARLGFAIAHEEPAGTVWKKEETDPGVLSASLVMLFEGECCGLHDEDREERLECHREAPAYGAVGFAGG